MASLILLKSPTGATAPQTYAVDMTIRKRLVIGRQKEPASKGQPAADIVLDEGDRKGEHAVSRHHAILTFDGAGYFLQNIGYNGTKLNSVHLGEKSPPQSLYDRDRIRICDFHFRFDAPGFAKPKPPEESDTSSIQYSIASGSAQLFMEAASAARLRMLLDVSARLAGALELETLLPEILEVLFTLFAQAERGFVFLMDADGEAYPKKFRARKQGADEGYSRTIVRNCLRDMKACLCQDTSTAGVFNQADSLAESPIHSFMCVPLTTAAGAALGALQLDTQNRGQIFSEDDTIFLTWVAKFAAMAIERAHLHETLKEVEYAQKVQIGFLPQSMPRVPGYDFYAFYNAAKLVGGDYYDFIELPNGKWAILLGDVSGKGIPASLLMVKLGAEARMCMLSQPDPAKAVGMLNDNLIRAGIQEQGKYVTLVAAVVDPAAHAVSVVTAGHAPPLRFRTATGEFHDCFEEELNSYPLGWLAGYEYEARHLDLAPGEMLFLFTDGVTDARSPKPNDALFGKEGVLAAIQACADRTRLIDPKALSERIVEAVKRHTRGQSQEDDIALVCFGRPKAALG